MKQSQLFAEKLAGATSAKANERIEKLYNNILTFDDINRLDGQRTAQDLTLLIFLCCFDIIDEVYEKELYEAQRRTQLRPYHISDELIYDVLLGLDIEKVVSKNVAQYILDTERIKRQSKQARIPRKEVEELIRAKTGTIGESGLTYQIMRILRTVTNEAVNASAIKAYKDAGVEKYMYHAILDNRECTRCHDLDARIFPVIEAKKGVNLPPLHPNCRCYITPASPVIENITFAEWQKQYLK